MSGEIATADKGRPTPGPWRIYGPQPDTLGGRRLAILAGTGKARFGVADIRIIDPNDALEASANARLIAAAPELFEALRKLSFAAQTSGGTAGRDEALVAAINEADAALAKARGQ
jgi:hypothetical protein